MYMFVIFLIIEIFVDFYFSFAKISICTDFDCRFISKREIEPKRIFTVKKNGSISPSAYVQLSCENEIDMLISLSFHLILFFKKNWCLLMSRCIFHIKHLSHVFTKNGCFPLQQAKSIWCVWNPWKMGFDLSTHLLQKIQTIKYLIKSVLSLFLSLLFTSPNFSFSPSPILQNVYEWHVRRLLKRKDWAMSTMLIFEWNTTVEKRRFFLVFSSKSKLASAHNILISKRSFHFSVFLICM